MAWSDERIELLKKLWSEGLSASMIACELGGVTRNAVIGKICRLDLPARKTRLRAKVVRKRRPRPATAKNSPSLQVSPEEVERLIRPAEDDIPTKTLGELETIGDRLEPDETRGCRHRIDVPFKGEPYGFCGKEALPGLYCCEQHAARWFSNWPVIKHRFVKEKVKETEAV